MSDIAFDHVSKIFPRNGGYFAALEDVSFTVDEANMLGLGVVDQRHIGSLNGVETFIY